MITRLASSTCSSAQRPTTRSAYIVASIVLLAACDPAGGDDGGIRFDAPLEDAAGGGGTDTVRVRIMRHGAHPENGLADLEPVEGATVHLTQHIDGIDLVALTDADGFAQLNRVNWTAPVDIHAWTSSTVRSLLALTPEHVSELESMGWAPDGVPLFVYRGVASAPVSLTVLNPPAGTEAVALFGPRNTGGAALLTELADMPFNVPRDEVLPLNAFAYDYLGESERGESRDLFASLRITRDLTTETAVTVDFAAAVPTNTLSGNFQLPDSPYFARYRVTGVWPFNSNGAVNGVSTRVAVDDATRTVSYELEVIDPVSETELRVTYGTTARSSWARFSTDGASPNLYEPGDALSPGFDATVMPGTSITWLSPENTQLSQFYVYDTGPGYTIWSGVTLAAGGVTIPVPPADAPIPPAEGGLEIQIYGCSELTAPEYGSGCAGGASSGAWLFAM